MPGVSSLQVYCDQEQTQIDFPVRQALARLVRSAEMHAEVFGTVPELVTRASAEVPDCVIADIRMPDTSGLDIPGLLAQRDCHPPVIFVTAYDTEENRAAARRVQAAAFFHKPVDGQALLDAIAWAVDSAPTNANALRRSESSIP